MIMVILDVVVLRRLLLERGFGLSIIDAGGYSWVIEKSTSDGEQSLKFSHHLEGRIVMECLSLRWMLDSNEDIFGFAEKLGGAKGK